jgi:metallo-beta-lactamase family protein
MGAADYLLVESTYGNRLHPSENTRDELAHVINEAARRGGSLVVPAFALGRTQTLLYVIRELKAAGSIPDLPIYVDSPMAVDVTRLFSHYMEDFDDEARAIFDKTGVSPILSPNLHFTRTTEESKKLNESRFPSVIISASGMATGGRILHHLAQKLPDPRNTVLFIGFQANGTRGQILKDGAREIKIHGEQVPVRAQIKSMESFSAHADSSEILRWLKTFHAPPKLTFVVHGEPGASEALASKIHEALGWKTHVPDLLESVELT